MRSLWMISIGKSDKRTTYNIGSCRTGKAVVSAAFTSVSWGTHLVLSWHKGRSTHPGGDLWLIACQDWHDGVNGESNNARVFGRGEGGGLWESVEGRVQ